LCCYISSSSHDFVEGESDGDSYKSVDDSLSDDMDDADYFEQEVGKKPEHGRYYNCFHCL